MSKNLFDRFLELFESEGHDRETAAAMALVAAHPERAVLPRRVLVDLALQELQSGGNRAPLSERKAEEPPASTKDKPETHQIEEGGSLWWKN